MWDWLEVGGWVLINFPAGSLISRCSDSGVCGCCDCWNGAGKRRSRKVEIKLSYGSNCIGQDNTPSSRNDKGKRRKCKRISDGQRVKVDVEVATSEGGLNVYYQ